MQKDTTTGMAYSKTTNIWKGMLFSRTAALTVIFMIVFLGFGLVSVIGKSIEASRDRKNAEAEAAALMDKDASMSRKLASINTPEGKEAALREQFPVVKTGEHVVVITDPAKEKSAASDSSHGGFWNFLKHLFSKD